MSDIQIKVQIIRVNTAVMEEFVMNPLARLALWESRTDGDIIILPERLGLRMIEIRTVIVDEKGKTI